MKQPPLQHLQPVDKNIYLQLIALARDVADLTAVPRIARRANQLLADEWEARRQIERMGVKVQGGVK